MVGHLDRKPPLIDAPVLFERVNNAVGRGAPGTPIAFNTSPEDTDDAAERWLTLGRDAAGAP